MYRWPVLRQHRKRPRLSHTLQHGSHGWRLLVGADIHIDATVPAGAQSILACSVAVGSNRRAQVVDRRRVVSAALLDAAAAGGRHAAAFLERGARPAAGPGVRARLPVL
eukprot:364370-Chlamydomonas_euryale.AAC.10